MRMWFAMHVRSGCEPQAVKLLQSIPKANEIDEVFCPMAACLRRDHGKQVEDAQPMFEGLVFVVAPSKWELRACMCQADGLQAMLDGRPPFEEMFEGEEIFIDQWATRPERIAPISEAKVDKTGRATVTDGPLFGRENEIRKYGTGHRTAYLKTTIAGKPARACVGVRVVTC